MKKNDLKQLIKEHILDILNEASTTSINTAKANLQKWIAKSPTIAQNLQKLRAEPINAGSVWGVFAYDNRGNKMKLVGGLTSKVAKELLKPISTEVAQMIQQPQQSQQPPFKPTAMTGLPTPQVPQRIPFQAAQPTGGSDTDTTMFVKK
jgi:hypothetical protein